MQGQIGIDLRQKAPPTSAQICRNWVSEQINNGIFRSRCTLNCAPTLSLARFALGARFRSLFKRFKTGFNGLPNYCIFSATWGRTDADECCYTYYGNPFWYDFSLYYYFNFYLESFPSIGAGYWHAYHPNRNFQKFLEDENAYQTCCTEADSTPQSCAEFYSVRPPCESTFWFFPTQWGKFCLFRINAVLTTC